VAEKRAKSKMVLALTLFVDAANDEDKNAISYDFHAQIWSRVHARVLSSYLTYVFGIHYILSVQINFLLLFKILLKIQDLFMKLEERRK